YGSNPDCDIRYSQVQYEESKTTFIINSEEFSIKDKSVEISLYGEKNVSNATGVIAMCLRLGFEFQAICDAISGYTGAKRRFELKFFEQDIYLFDDYAHHPAEIEATIKAIQTRFPNRRNIVIFQPHTYSRTAQFCEEFVESLSLADQVLLLPIFASAREKGSNDSITSEKLVQVAREKSIQHILSFPSEKELLLNLKKNIGSGDLILTMGAGNVYKMEGEIRKLVVEIRG
ncbi:UDP-N-acetylmuramate--L-alanine ligase, partial [Candidatus Woesebacteria bacterium]|nr:UDP-N-acetylmuramate--L-alanine ligase [Candidatus Woesebacteria bacterium]